MAGRTAAAAGSCWTCWRSQQCSAPSQSRVSVCCRLCLTFTEKINTGMERSGPTPCALCLASLLCSSGAGGAPTAAADRHRCWTGAGRMYVLVCIAADFWPGLERASEGRTARRGIRFLRLSPPTSGLARIGRQGGAQLDAEFAFLRFSPPTSGLAWMGRWRGALPWRGACLSLFHSLASRREAKLCSVTGPNTI